MLICSMLLCVAAGSPDSPAEQVFAGLGPHTRPITTKSRKAQALFNQGLNFLYGFNHDEALRSFAAALREDQRCAMALWGLAMANGPHINNPAVPAERERAGFQAIARARALTAGAKPVERALIEAASKRFAQPQPANRQNLDQAFAKAMAGVWKRFPWDADVGALYAEALMDLQPWDYWDTAGLPKGQTALITKTLERVLELNPRHPQALHLTIHAWEASAKPSKAGEAADRLRDLQPALGHMVHMPSHIDVRTGEWHKAILANEKAIRADDEYTKLRPRQGFYKLYMGHNRHMLAHAAMMTGESKKAIAAVDDMVKRIPVETIGDMAPVLDGYFAAPYDVRVRFGMWDGIIAMPEIPEVFPLARAMRRAARGVAHAAKGQVAEALNEEAGFLEARKQVPATSFMGNNSAADLLEVAGLMLRGEILLAEGKLPAAISQLAKAVRAEDALRYDEPPDWINPVRHALGAALMRAGRYSEAEAVYREDLKRLPNNGWSLFGLNQALLKQGKGEAADRVQKRFETAWSRADVKITSSCMCLPGADE